MDSLKTIVRRSTTRGNLPGTGILASFRIISSFVQIVCADQMNASRGIRNLQRFDSIVVNPLKCVPTYGDEYRLDFNMRRPRYGSASNLRWVEFASLEAPGEQHVAVGNGVHVQGRGRAFPVRNRQPSHCRFVLVSLT